MNWNKNPSDNNSKLQPLTWTYLRISPFLHCWAAFIPNPQTPARIQQREDSAAFKAFGSSLVAVQQEVLDHTLYL